jgi:hypothetical protein
MKKFHSIAFVFVLLFYSKLSFSQNLVSNGSFESVNACPSGLTLNPPAFNSNQYPTGWVLPTDGTPDYLNNCNCNSPNNGYMCPSGNNLLGACQIPQDGNAFVTIFTNGLGLDGGPFREYLQTRLISPLVQGGCYTFSFWTCVASGSQSGTALQAYFSTNANRPFAQNAAHTNTGVLNIAPGVPQCNTSVSNPLIGTHIDNKQYWQQFTFSFVALGGEEWLTIGNFYTNQGHPISTQGYPGCVGLSLYQNNYATDACYLIDNVSLTFDVGSGFTPSPGCVFSPIFGTNNINTNTVLTGKNIIIDGTLNLNANVVLHNCHVRFTEGAAIDTHSNGLKIDQNSDLSCGCNNMWQGILNAYNVQVDHSSISDAVEAISGTPFECNITNSVFDGNVTHIHFTNPSPTYYGVRNIMYGNTFKHTQPLKEQWRTTTPPYGTNSVIIESTGAPYTSESSPFVIGDLSNYPSNSPAPNNFIGGQFGVIVRNSSVHLVYNSFTDVQQIALLGDGTNTPVTALNPPNIDVSGNQFAVVNNPNTTASAFILFENNISSAIKQSIFNNSWTYAIQYVNNHNCNLTIGDQSFPNLANDFFLNNWAGVICYDNASTNIPGPHQGSSIKIDGNRFTDPNYATAIIVQESVLGSNPQYDKLVVSANQVQNTGNGIVVNNIRGVNNGTSIPSPNLQTDIINNNINYLAFCNSGPSCSVYDAGVTCKNSPGFRFMHNSSTCVDAPFDWRNNGFWFENSENTLTFNNTAQAGKGIRLSGDMLGSNIYCNTMTNGASGISLEYEVLRPTNVSHGNATAARANGFISPPTWGSNIDVYYTSTSNNQWVWDNINFPITTYTQSPGSIFTPLIGGNTCTSARMVQDDMPPNPNVVVSDPVLQWKLNYEYEAQKINTHIGNSGVASVFIKKLINFENAFSQADYTHASQILGTMSPTLQLEQNFMAVYEILVASRLPVSRAYTQAEFDELIAIAKQSPRIAGPAVYSARAILRYEKNMDFQNPEDLEATISGVAFVNGTCNYPVVGVTLNMIDQNGNIAYPGLTAKTDSSGNFMFNPFMLRALNSSTLYGFSVQQPSQLAVYKTQFQTVSQWMSSSPINLPLAFVKIDTIVKSLVADTILARQVAVDPSGNIYTVGTILQNSTSDYYVSKSNSSHQLIWSKTYNGNANGNDSARAILVDSISNVYVTGQSWNGVAYDYVTLKYDSLGQNEWIAIYSDTANANAIGMAISMNSAQINVAGKIVNGPTTSYATVKYSQCLGSTRRMVNPKKPIVSPPLEKQVEFKLFPNPNNGNMELDYLIPENYTEVFLVIHDMMGKEVLRTILDKNKTHSDFTALQLERGIYVYSVFSDQKLIKQDRLVIIK